MPETLSPEPIRVLLVDDHEMILEGLRLLLIDVEDIEIVGTAGDGREAVRAAEALRPAIILMDLVMPEMDGVTAIGKILERDPRARILALSGSGREEKILAALEAGAQGFLSKNGGKEATVGAIRKVARGEPSLPPTLTRRLLERCRPAAGGGPLEPLSEREIEVLRLVARGLTNAEIAERIHLALGTVRAHASSILSKLGVRNRVLATLWALREGIASLDDESAQEPAGATGSQ